jgi:hypothetical protein
MQPVLPDSNQGVPYQFQQQPAAPNPQPAAVPAQTNVLVDPAAVAIAYQMFMQTQGRSNTISIAEGNYEGSIVNGVPEGQGKLTYLGHPTRKEYNGQFAKGKPNGLGMILFHDGKIYEGQMEDGECQGQGKMTIKDSNGTWIYTGPFVKGAYEGEGVKEYRGAESSYVYRGEFKDGKFEGNGVKEERSKYGFWITKGTFKEGEIYNGKWQDGLNKNAWPVKYIDGVEQKQGCTIC